MIILSSDYHTHTVFSHGKGTILENATRAKEIGLKEIGISDHGFAHPAFGLTKRKVPKMRQLVDEAKSSLGINVLLGIESNLIGEEGYCDLKEEQYDNFDLFLAGIHKFVKLKRFKDYFGFFGKNFFTNAFHKKPSDKVIKITTNAYINAIKNNPIDAITHLNYCVFCDPVEVAKCARDYGTYIELNSKKTHLSLEQLNDVANTGVRFIINSDAHSVDRVGEIKLVEEILKNASVDLSQIDNIDGRLPKFRFAEFKRSR